jgi:hypothetical protein
MQAFPHEEPQALMGKGMPQAALMPDDDLTAPFSAIDLDHLGRMSFHDETLARELLELFDRQAVVLVARMRRGEGGDMVMLAHTLKGSATGIGAWGVARAAAACEHAAEGSPAERALALDALGVAVEEARAEIAGMLQPA